MRSVGFNRRFLVAALVGSLVAAGLAVLIQVAELGEGWNYLALLVGLLVGSLTDREGFYGTPPRQPRG
jgi:hypothetical protein